ncbi:undecaprenyl-diphosphate phosphatase [Rubrobacter calidifluminis]|uniref:undecaprenyl-diphosphate phosphatase n=1 Tax=Rubrobacter calidifluminis TaxID=1392640 RepID=UPI0023629EBF|nr:undecaprenyl-diphosphate phosphatase [Rubrobacter calidifluminis]
MSIWEAFVLALLQGATEILPVSSLGHGVILPSLLGWDVNQDSPTFLPFFVVLHLGTAAALFAFFRREWWAIIRGFFLSLSERSLRGNEDGRLAWLVIVGTIPAGLVGLLFEKGLSANFGRPMLAAIVLVFNGIFLLAGERIRRKRIKEGAAQLSFWQAVAVGTSQVLALIPGISRSGVTVVGGMASGLKAEVAARFSFLLATPIILSAGVLEVPKLVRYGTAHTLEVALFGGVVAGIAAYLSTAALMYLFKRREIEALGPFGYYCIAAGLVAAVVLGLR